MGAIKNRWRKTAIFLSGAISLIFFALFVTVFGNLSSAVDSASIPHEPVPHYHGPDPTQSKGDFHPSVNENEDRNPIFFGQNLNKTQLDDSIHHSSLNIENTKPDPISSSSAPDIFTPDRIPSASSDLINEDPFIPNIGPFKRDAAYDHLNADYTVRVANPSIDKVQVGNLAFHDMDEFEANLSLVLEHSLPTRIPTPGSNFYIASYSAIKNDLTQVSVPLQFVSDSAQNLYVIGRSPGSMAIHLKIHFAVLHESFGGDFGDPSYEELGPAEVLTEEQTAASEEIFLLTGTSRKLSVRENVKRLTRYFRSFEGSDKPINSGQNIYLDIARGKNGVCRHRAFAFMVTALSLHIPTRIVVSDVHAWVEVAKRRVSEQQGGHSQWTTIWHRVDLGGAGTLMESSSREFLPFQGPPDGFVWPSDKPSTFERWTSERSSPMKDGRVPPSQQKKYAANVVPLGMDGMVDKELSNISPDRREHLNNFHLEAHFETGTFHPLEPVRYEMVAKAPDLKPCSYLSLQIFAGETKPPSSRDPKRAARLLGHVTTDELGRASGLVILPKDMGLGKHQIWAQATEASYEDGANDRRRRKEQQKKGRCTPSYVFSSKN